MKKADSRVHHPDFFWLRLWNVPLETLIAAVLLCWMDMGKVTRQLDCDFLHIDCRALARFLRAWFHIFLWKPDVPGQFQHQPSDVHATAHLPVHIFWFTVLRGLFPPLPWRDWLIFSRDLSAFSQDHHLHPHLMYRTYRELLQVSSHACSISRFSFHLRLKAQVSGPICYLTDLPGMSLGYC